MRTQVHLPALRRMRPLGSVDAVVVSHRLAVRVLLAASSLAHAVVVADGTIDTDIDAPIDTDGLVDPTVDEVIDVTIDDLVDPDEAES